MKFCNDDILQLLELSKKRKVYLEGNILKLIETDNDEFAAYLQEAKEKDSETRKKRLGITKQVQEQNKELAKKAQQMITDVEQLKEQRGRLREELMKSELLDPESLANEMQKTFRTWWCNYLEKEKLVEGTGKNEGWPTRNGVRPKPRFSPVPRFRK